MNQTLHPYEIHITSNVSPTQVDDFVSLCESIAVKPIVLDLPNVSTREVMTKSVVTSKSVHQAVGTANTQAMWLTSGGFEVARIKIETTPTHPQAPSVANDTKLKPGAHFETHYKIIVTSESDDQTIDVVVAEYGLYKSRNIFKHFSDGSYHQMVTDRDYDTTAEVFIDRTSTIANRMVECGLVLAKRPIVEFSIYDTNPRHDNVWLGASYA